MGRAYHNHVAGSSKTSERMDLRNEPAEVFTFTDRARPSAPVNTSRMRPKAQRPIGVPGPPTSTISLTRGGS
ncbi:hypothetical protein T03_17264 [Trichinella britovi]|uniref:Uncharacterized protein n=1 Tax=Trichinella britovi TaxID=45882 RepID=A0A0V1DEE5_TRIBR|nr:hypothetical protein T03_17264 [Trichinella britovi]